MKKLLALLIVALLLPSEGYGILVTYSDRPSWEAALDGIAILQDFEGVGADDDFTGGSTTVGTLTLSSVEESAFSNNALVDVSPFVSVSDINGNVNVSMRFLNHSPADTVTVALPVGQSAFAFEYNNYDNQNDGAKLSFAGDNGADVTVFGTSSGFFGLVDTDAGAIASFTFTGDDNGGTGSSTFMSFDDVRYGVAAVASVPEPTGFALFGLISGLAACIVGIRRLSHSSPDSQSA